MFVELFSWFECDGFKLNHGKTQSMNLRMLQAREFVGEGVIVQRQEMSVLESAKFLGTQLDSNLTWINCIEAVANKLYSSTYQMLVLRDVIDIKTRIIIYYADFCSIMQYGIVFWGF